MKYYPVMLGLFHKPWNKDPYETTRIQWEVSCFFSFSSSFVEYIEARVLEVSFLMKIQVGGRLARHCWWKKSCTTCYLWNPMKNGMFSISNRAGFVPSIVEMVKFTRFFGGFLFLPNQKTKWNSRNIFPIKIQQGVWGFKKIGSTYKVG